MAFGPSSMRIGVQGFADLAQLQNRLVNGEHDFTEECFPIPLFTNIHRPIDKVSIKVRGQHLQKIIEKAS